MFRQIHPRSLHQSAVRRCADQSSTYVIGAGRTAGVGCTLRIWRGGIGRDSAYRRWSRPPHLPIRLRCLLGVLRFRGCRRGCLWRPSSTRTSACTASASRADASLEGPPRHRHLPGVAAGRGAATTSEGEGKGDGESDGEGQDEAEHENEREGERPHLSSCRAHEGLELERAERPRACERRLHEWLREESVLTATAHCRRHLGRQHVRRHSDSG